MSKSQSNLCSPNNPKVNDNQSSHRNQTVSMIKLGEWLRLSAYSQGFGRNVFDLALVMLK